MTDDKLIPEITDVNRAYWEGTAQGELRVQRCRACGARFRFNHLWCPECGTGEPEWERVSGRGVVTNMSVIHMPPFHGYADEVPYVLALIQLDEGVRMMANVVNCDPATVSIGLPVQVAFEQRGDIVIPQFERV